MNALLELVSERLEKTMSSIFRIVAFAALLLPLLTSCQQSSKNIRVGVDPLPPVVAMENHYGSFWAWKKASVRNRIVVHVDTHIDLNWMPEKDVRAVLQAADSSELRAVSIRPGQFYEPGKRVLHVGNWLYPALRSGMVKKLYWVVPDRSVCSPQWLRALKIGMRLHFTNVNPREIESFHIQSSVIEGELFGIPITILPLSELPLFTKPILLDIDLDYFQFDSALLLNRLPSPQKSVRQFVKILMKKKVASDLVTLCYSVEQGYLDFKNRSLGDSLLKALAVPSGALSSDFLQKSIKAKFSVEQLNQFQADAHFYDQEYQKAFELYRAIIRRRPEALKARFNLAECELMLGRPQNALRTLQAIEKNVSQFPRFWEKMGDCHEASEEYLKAVQDYRKALALDPQNGRLWKKLGLMWERLNDFQKAEIALKTGIRTWPFETDIRIELYLLYKRLHLANSARTCLIELLQVDPKHLGAQAELARISKVERQRGLSQNPVNRP